MTVNLKPVNVKLTISEAAKELSYIQITALQFDKKGLFQQLFMGR